MLPSHHLGPYRLRYSIQCVWARVLPSRKKWEKLDSRPDRHSQKTTCWLIFLPCQISTMNINATMTTVQEQSYDIPYHDVVQPKNLQIRKTMAWKAKPKHNPERYAWGYINCNDSTSDCTKQGYRGNTLHAKNSTYELRSRDDLERNMHCWPWHHPSSRLTRAFARARFAKRVQAARGERCSSGKRLFARQSDE